MWESNGEKTDLSEGNEKDKEPEADDAPEVRGSGLSISFLVRVDKKGT